MSAGGESGRPGAGRGRLLLFGAVTAGAALLASLLAAELMLRLLGHRGQGASYLREDAELTWVVERSAQADVQGRDFRFAVHTNSLGLRGDELRSGPQTRILLLGDSYVFGYGVDDAETFAARLQELFDTRGPPGIEVVNAGVPGYGAAQARRLAARLWDAVDPALAIYVHCGNDFADDVRFSRGSYAQLRNRVPGREFLKRHSALYNVAKPMVLALLSKLGIYNLEIRFEGGAEAREGALVSELGQAWARGRDLTCAAVAGIGEDARERGARLAVTTVGFWPDGDGLHFSRDARAFEDCAAARGIPFLDPTRAFPARETEPWTNQNSAGHYSPLGNRFYAESLYEDLLEQGLLP
jgi:lysophospholipase L1-like esterase